MSAAANLSRLGLALPKVPTPVGSYVPGVRVGNLVLTSGQLPFADGELMYPGHVGADVTIDQACACAKCAALNALAVAAKTAGGLDRIKRIIRLAVYVASAPGFNEQPKVANGASDLLADIFGDHGKHARAAVGTNELPLNSCLELELTVEVV